MISRLLFRVVLFVTRMPKWVVFGLLAGILVLPFVGIIGAKVYQYWDDDPDRGAIAITDGAFGESYAVPEYLDQGWDANDSLWFYNTTQGSGLMPYDFFLVLRQADSDELFRSNKNIDKFRYLPQKKTFFNEHALPVGFVKDTYQGKDYIGYTCAACHTGQVNYKGKAIRIDGAPAMGDMVGFLTELEKSLNAAQKGMKGETFVRNVIALNNDYSSAKEVKQDLKKWTDTITLYNTINQTDIEYGNARLDAFGRIYNRVIQHVINKKQVAKKLRSVTVKKGGTQQRLLSDAEIDKVLQNVGKPDDIILRDGEFWKIIRNLKSDEPGFPGLNVGQMLLVRDEIFNPPNAPVSYPFLWDIAQSDYVQWNGIASNAGVGPLGRNAGEVIGVFGILDWKEDKSWLGLSSWWRRFRLSTFASGQTNKRKAIDFDSSIDLFNLGRLERHLHSLKSPKWPGKILGKINEEKAAQGQLIYARLCQSCHEVIDRDNSERKVIAKMLRLRKAGTDKAMAVNSVTYTGKSGNFKHTYQSTGVGKIIVPEDAPVAVILTAATKGVVTTPDPDKWFPRRWAEWVYTLVSSLFDNDIKSSIKSGDYDPDTTANPFASLLAYKARSLNGIWATAPYLHNGSVPSLYDLLLPVKRPGDIENGRCERYRPDSFMVGAREFDPQKVGFKSEGYKGFEFKTDIRGNKNTGHEYGACRMKDGERWDLIEYLKSL